jgi:hypothetical protein
MFSLYYVNYASIELLKSKGGHEWNEGEGSSALWGKCYRSSFGASSDPATLCMVCMYLYLCVYGVKLLTGMETLDLRHIIVPQKP